MLACKTSQHKKPLNCKSIEVRTFTPPAVFHATQAPLTFSLTHSYKMFQTFAYSNSNKGKIEMQQLLRLLSQQSNLNTLIETLISVSENWQQLGKIHLKTTLFSPTWWAVHVMIF